MARQAALDLLMDEVIRTFGGHMVEDDTKG